MLSESELWFSWFDPIIFALLVTVDVQARDSAQDSPLS